MADPDPARHPDPKRPGAGPPPLTRHERRRQKIAEEIARNRRGEYVVPTWVLTLILVLVVAGWIALVTLA